MSVKYTVMVQYLCNTLGVTITTVQHSMLNSCGETVSPKDFDAWILGSVAESLDRPRIHLLPQILYLNFIFYEKI